MVGIPLHAAGGSCLHCHASGLQIGIVMVVVCADGCSHHGRHVSVGCRRV